MNESNSNNIAKLIIKIDTAFRTLSSLNELLGKPRGILIIFTKSEIDTNDMINCTKHKIHIIVSKDIMNILSFLPNILFCIRFLLGNIMLHFDINKMLQYCQEIWTKYLGEHIEGIKRNTKNKRIKSTKSSD